MCIFLPLILNALSGHFWLNIIFSTYMLLQRLVYATFIFFLIFIAIKRLIKTCLKLKYHVGVKCFISYSGYNAWVKLTLYQELTVLMINVIGARPEISMVPSYMNILDEETPLLSLSLPPPLLKLRRWREPKIWHSLRQRCPIFFFHENPLSPLFPNKNIHCIKP